VTTSDDDTAIIWSVQTGEQVYCLEIAKTSLYKPSLSNDSQYILTATSDYTVIVWRMEDGS